MKQRFSLYAALLVGTLMICIQARTIQLQGERIDALQHNLDTFKIDTADEILRVRHTMSDPADFRPIPHDIKLVPIDWNDENAGSCFMLGKSK